MARLFQQVPVERVVMAPFLFLTELIAHEEQFLAGVPEHEAVIGTHVGESLPVVPGHSAKDRTLAVHNFVMRERKDEVFEERVVQPKQNLTMAMAPIDRILADVVEGIVHPPHVPLVAKAKPASIDR